jgi:hypothetical protein
MNPLWHGHLARVKKQSWAGHPCHISSRSRQERFLDTVHEIHHEAHTILCGLRDEMARRFLGKTVRRFFHPSSEAGTKWRCAKGEQPSPAKSDPKKRPTAIPLAETRRNSQTVILSRRHGGHREKRPSQKNQQPIVRGEILSAASARAAMDAHSRRNLHFGAR